MTAATPKRDLGQILRFCIVGSAIAALYLGLFVLFLRLGASEAIANVTSLAVAVVVQYVAQTAWTFRKPLGMPDQIFRFACAIALGFVTSTLITAWLGPKLGWTPELSGIVVMVWLPVQNFAIFRIWVYASDG